MYRHALYLVDCTEESRREAVTIARHLAPLTNCRMTLVAMVTPTEDAVLKEKREQHAEEALRRMKNQLHACGLITRQLVLEGENPAAALVEESWDGRGRWQYDVIVLGAHHARTEFDEFPCRGSVADQVAQRTDLPILLFGPAASVKL